MTWQRKLLIEVLEGRYGVSQAEIKAITWALGEVDRYEAAIRKHRDQRLDDRCWMDDIELYEALPEGADPKFVDLRQLPEAEMLANCAQFVKCRRTEATPKEAIVAYKEVKLGIKSRQEAEEYLAIKPPPKDHA